MRSNRTVKFNPNFTNHVPQTLNFTIPDGSRRKPTPKGILKKKNGKKSEAVAAEPPVVAFKNLVVGQVKILKRGEDLNDSSRVLKDVNCREEFAVKDSVVADREASDGRRLLPEKKENNTVKNKKVAPLVVAGLENVSKQRKNVTECFAGSVFFDSPPASSVPLPGFLRRNLLNT